MEWFHRYGNNHKTRLAHDLDLLRRDYPDPKSTRLLELGAVPLILTSAIARDGYDAVGVDIDPSRFSPTIEANSLDVVKHLIGKNAIPMPDESFDVVLCNEIFEHLGLHLVEAFEDILRILAPGGRLYLSTPNLKSYHGLSNFLLRGRAYSCATSIYDEHDRLRSIGHMGHVREYTVTEVHEFLEAIGFHTVEVRYRGRSRGRLRRLDAIPRLRPFFSIVAEK